MRRLIYIHILHSKEEEKKIKVPPTHKQCFYILYAGKLLFGLSNAPISFNLLNIFIHLDNEATRAFVLFHFYSSLLARRHCAQRTILPVHSCAKVLYLFYICMYVSITNQPCVAWDFVVRCRMFILQIYILWLLLLFCARPPYCKGDQDIFTGPLGVAVSFCLGVLDSLEYIYK